MKKRAYTINVEGKDVELTELEVAVVRFCAQHYIEKGEYAAYSELPGFKEHESSKFERLFQFGLLKSFSSNGIRIPKSTLGIVEQWDNPPLPDYRDKITKWFWSKPWSVPVLIFLVGIPVVIEWLKLVKFIVEWFSTYIP